MFITAMPPVRFGTVWPYMAWRTASTSVSRKSVLPVFEELNGLLFYPVQYEGEESSRNVFYTGAAPNQQAIPAVEYLMSEAGGGAERFVLLGTDYPFDMAESDPVALIERAPGLDERERAALAGGNAERLLGLAAPVP